VTQAPVAFWRSEELGADLLRARFENFAYDLHTHDTACFALITGGAIRIRMRGSEFVAGPGDLYAIDADEAHAGWAEAPTGWSQRTIYIGLERLLSSLGEGYGAPAAINGPVIRDETMSSLFFELHRHVERSRSRLHRDELVLAFAERLATRHMQSAPARSWRAAEPRAVRIVRDYLDQHLDERVSLDDLVEAVGVPRFRLYRAFERATGMTPHAYQRQARVRRAIELLKTGASLADIAVAAGFSDQAHFTRSFHARMALTPGAFRSALGN